MNSRINYNIVGYFQYFYSILGNRLLFNMLLGVMVSLLDGIGLAMFIPLLQFVNDGASVNREALGGMHHIISVFDGVGIPITLLTVLLLMLSVFCLKGILSFWQINAQVDLRQKYMVKIRHGQADALKKISYEGFLKLDAGTIQNTLTAEVQKLLQSVTSFLGSIKGLVMLSTYIFLAFIANWQFALLVAVGGGISNLLFRKVFASVKNSSVKVSQKGHLFNSAIIQAVHAFKYLKSTNHFSVFESKLKIIVGEIEKANRKIGFNQALTASTREPIIIAIVALVILIQVQLMGSSLGSIILSILLFYRALTSLILVQTTWQTFMQNVGAIQSTSDLSFEMQLHAEIQESKSFTGFKKSIYLSGVDFTYGEHKVLRDLNIIVPKNQTIALVGESGSGKTTVANLITALIKPVKGNLLVDGIPLSDYNLDLYRSRIGYISQEPIIFTDNIFNNVTFWAEPTKENLERFWGVVEKTSLKDFIHQLKEKEQTMLGDNGILISGGQKQRISIARELYKDIDILIMDEATSALDSETENFIQKSIASLQGQYTMIIIAHRLATIKNADKIYVLDKGMVVGEGKFEELVVQSDRFSRMVDLQNMM